MSLVLGCPAGAAWHDGFEGAGRTMAVSRMAVSVIIFIWLCGCGGFGSPEVIAGGETTVSIKGGKMRNPDSLADNYCSQYGRTAVEVGRRSVSYNELSVLYVYDCVGK